MLWLPGSRIRVWENQSPSSCYHDVKERSPKIPELFNPPARSCDHLYHTTQFKGVVSFVDDFDEKRRALEIMVKQLDDNPGDIIER